MAATRRKHRLAAGILFLIYFVVLFYFLFFSEKMGRTYSERAYHYNLVPLKEIARFVKYWRVLGMKAVLLNILGNVAAFLPFGFFLPVIWERTRHWYITVILSFAMSLLVETMQLVGKVGSFDVDDLLLNTLGGMAGYGLYRLFVRYYHQRNQRGKESGETT